MAHNPHTPQGPEGNTDPAGSTQMFRAFVEEGEQAQPVSGARQESGGWSGKKKALVIGVGVVLVLAFVVLSIPNRPWTIW